MKKKIEISSDCSIDFEKCVIIRNKKETPLSGRSKLLLETFVNNQNKVLTYDNIFAILWPDDNYTPELWKDQIKDYINKVRKVIGDNDKSIIQNRHGIGYVFCLTSTESKKGNEDIYFDYFTTKIEIRGNFGYYHEVPKYLKSAKSSIIICEPSQHINDLRFDLKNLKKDVKLTFIIPDYDNKELKTTAKKVFWRSDKDIENRVRAQNMAIEYIKENRDCKVIDLDTFLPYCIIAIDCRDKEINDETSLIVVGLHLLAFAKTKAQRHNFVVRPKDGRIFEDYRKQILFIEELDGKLEK